MYQGVRVAGFGGQGIVSAGVLLAQAGLMDGKAVSWYPSYGPEMRGGTANCSVVISGTEVFTPVVSAPDTAIVMNEPALAKFEPMLKKDGLLIINSSLIKTKPKRSDIRVVYVDCNGIAEKAGSLKAATLVALGAFAGITGAISIASIEGAMKKVFKRAKQEALEINRKALEEGAKIK